MSPRAGELLLDVVRPMLIAVVPQVVKTTGAEDHAELVQDGMVMAAQAIDMLERRGRELMPRSVAYYTIQRLKSGRRSQHAAAWTRCALRRSSMKKWRSPAWTPRL